VNELKASSNLRNYDAAELTELFTSMGIPAFRAKQVHQWLWKQHVLDFDKMENIPKALRTQLGEKFTLRRLEVKDCQESSDGTMKLAFSLDDGKAIEGVLIPAVNPDGEQRLTACVSSQAGCSLACTFCATARLKMMRNLFPDEIYDQVMALNVLAKERYGKGLTNVVYMGMGEPLLNYKNVVESIRLINAPEALGMSARRITLSTSGIAKMIHKLAEDKLTCKLALSLHAATNEKRSSIMPINDSNPLESLVEALKFYYKTMGRPVTYEYVLLDGVNDLPEDADALAAFCRHIPSKVNLIEYNPFEGSTLKRASYQRMKTFQEWLRKRGVSVSLRRSRGRDIDAACGQLANKQN
jgi:23S rRNA (adenine2503-C2)-methyltransferase